MILALAKAPADSGNLRGRSLTPILDGTGNLPEQAVYSEAWYARTHFGWSELTALTTPRLRYIRAPEEELYDLQRDPHQTREQRRGHGPSEADQRRPRRWNLALRYPSTPFPCDGTDGGRRNLEPAVDPKDKRREFIEHFRRAAGRSPMKSDWDQAIVLLDGRSFGRNLN